MTAVIGPAMFAILLLLAALALIAIGRALFAPRPTARWTPPVATRPCAVYEIDTYPAGVYVGHGPDPHERIMASHRRSKWWARTVTAQTTREPDRVDWYASKEIANTEEIRRIRAYHKAGRQLENRILYREGAA